MTFPTRGHVIVAAVLMLGPSQAVSAQSIAIVHGELIDGYGGAPIRDGVVIVRGDTIAALGAWGRVPIPDGARVIDATGKSVLPGLADMHVHLLGGWDGVSVDMLGFHHALNALLYSGVTTVLDTGNVLPYVQQMRQEVSEGRLAGPTIHMAGPVIDGADPVWPPTSIALASTEQIPAVIRQLKQARVDVVKGYLGLSERQLSVLSRAAQAESLPVIVDAGERNGTAVVAAAGITALAHLGTSPVTDEAVAIMRDRQIASITTLAARESFARRRLSDLEFLNGPLLARIMPTQFVTALRAFAARPPSDQARAATDVALERMRVAMANAKRLVDAGVLLAAGTDAPIPGAYYGEALHRELELLVEAGLTPLQALSAATRNAAAVLHEEGQWGTLAAGMRADILIVGGHPAARISDTRRVEVVIQNGVVIDRTALRFESATDPGYRATGTLIAGQE